MWCNNLFVQTLSGMNCKQIYSTLTAQSWSKELVSDEDNALTSVTSFFLWGLNRSNKSPVVQCSC